MNLELTTSTIVGLSYLISVPYVIWRIIKRYNKTSLDGVIGTTPGFDGIIFICGAPFWMIVDLIISWVMMVIEYRKSKKQDKQVL